MTLAIRSSPLAPAVSPRRTPRLGDCVAALASRYAAEMNASAMAAAIRERQVSCNTYRCLIATMYPVVVGFNRALIRSIAKVDHVRSSSFVRTLARQLEEEQAHDQLWRAMLEVFDIDHEALYDEFEEYVDAVEPDELDRRTRDVLADVRSDLRGGRASRFPDSVFPDPIVALCHHLWQSASDDDIPYWSHFASQAGIEMVIFDVVSASILPGVLGHPEVDRGAASTRWWMEHGRTSPQAVGGPVIDEEKHLALSRAALNRNEMANALAHDVVVRAEDTMRLFAASLITRRPRDHSFPIDRYLKQGTRP